MLRNIAAALTLAVALIALPVASQADEVYTPPKPRTVPTLAGSTISGECDGDVPWISFSVKLLDPDTQSTGHTASLTFASGANSTTIQLGEIVDGTLSGRILWPGASVAADGTPTGWPGWMQVGGRWVQTDGNFGWTRSVTTALITVNPELVVPLSYPPATPNCVTGPRTTTAGSSSVGLSSTGVSAWTVPIGAAALGLVAFGFIILLRRRLNAR